MTSGALHEIRLERARPRRVAAVDHEEDEEDEEDFEDFARRILDRDLGRV
jgi:hypothetical protein